MAHKSIKADGAIGREARFQLRSILDRILGEARRAGMTQAALARRANISPEALSRLKESARCDFETIANLADAAGMELTVRVKDDYADRLHAGLLRE